MGTATYNFILGSTTKPDRYKVPKDEKYHVEMGRYCADSGFCREHDKHMYDGSINLEFFRNNQWIIEEDIDNFLKDNSGNLKNRIKATKNKIIPIIAQYLGNARKMDLQFRVENLSPNAINRREFKLAELMFFTQLANNSDDSFKAYLKTVMPIGETMEETAELFDNIWVDEFTESVRQFDKVITEDTNLPSYQEDLAFDLAIWGLTGLRYDFHNGDFVVNKVEIDSFFFDRTCKRRDLQDAMFMGDIDPVSTEYLFERYRLNDLDKKALSDRNVLDIDGTFGRNPIVKAYWKDSEESKFGWVLDPFGYHYLVQLDTEDNNDGKKYTEDDLLPESELSDGEKSILEGNIGKMEVDVVRYCHFVPSEYLSTSVDRDGVQDIVLEFGVLEYQDTNMERIYNTKFPYKMGAWYYIKGEVFTPISALINPQRFINRMASVQENMINTAMPSNLMYDPGMVDDEAEFLSNMYEGVPNRVDTKGLGIQNLVQKVGGGFDSSVQLLDALMESQSSSMDRMTGINESLRGDTQGANKLVGVTALEIQRGSISQEGFYGVIADLYKDMHVSICNVARRAYADSGRRLAIMVGDRHAQILTMSSEYNTEDFRVYVKRIADPEQADLIAQERLLSLMERQIIGKPILAKYWDTPLDLSKAIKEQVMIDMEMQKAQQQEQQLAMQEDQQAMQQEQQLADQEAGIQEERQDAYKQIEVDQQQQDRQVDIEKTQMERQNKTIEKLANNQRDKR